MSATGVSPSDNGRAPETWSRPWTHLVIDRASPSFCRVTFDHPPINTITATTVDELAELVGLIEQDPDLNVVVFDAPTPTSSWRTTRPSTTLGERWRSAADRPGCMRGWTSSCGCPAPPW